MKFVDEVYVAVQAGTGGNGCLSFRRERCLPRGGPDGGDGGDGGAIYLSADEGLNTLVDFRHQPLFCAANGAAGQGSNRNGRRGEDLFIRVPLGTSVYNEETDELIGDLTRHQQQLLVAKGGQHGLGNARFKSSTNRAPRQITNGKAGERRTLRLELKVLADVGLLGLPNAGKSTLTAAISAAHPRIADYPFTTLYPILGVVHAGNFHSFVVADIPGLITGASRGVGLGIHFLKHLQRTRLLLHLLDISELSSIAKAANQLQAIEKELSCFDSHLADKERWLVFTKADTRDRQQADDFCRQLIAQLRWQKPWFIISAVADDGLAELIATVAEKLQSKDEQTPFTAVPTLAH